MESKEELISNFNPNDPGSTAAGIFGLPFSCEQADLVLVPVPWEATVSYGSGAANGPDAIFEASFQMDLNHYDYPNLWKRGIAFDELPEAIRTLSNETREESLKIIAALESGDEPRNDAHFDETYRRINASSQKMNQWVEQRTAHWMSQGKKVGLIGGDHSTPLGYLRALAQQHESFGVLVLDAHLDLRHAYEGFTWSHASIFYNVLQLPQVKKLVQVGIRDFCEEEVTFAQSQGDRITIFYDRFLQRENMRGKSWFELFQGIIDQLPQKIYVSVDIDGLDPSLCPNTGTPVPGGLSFEEAAFLFQLIGESGREIIGFDLCEVSPGNSDWDGNVGARMLYQLCGMVMSN